MDLHWTLINGYYTALVNKLVHCT